MIAVLQRVKRSAVRIDGEVVGECGHGLMILLGVAEGDTRTDADVLAAKISKLRIFCDENDKMNLSVKDIDGEMLVVSNFTLLANYAKGNRPDYMNAAAPDMANELYEYFVSLVQNEYGITAKKGVFGADMQIEQHNDGPVTILMEKK